MRRFVAGCFAVVVVVVASGCAEKVAVPPASARPDEVLVAFVKASIARDTAVGHELSGECWPDVADMFNREIDGFSTYTVPPQESPPPSKMEAWVDFSAEQSTGWPREGRFGAMLRRSGPGERWHVCDVVHLNEFP